MRDLAAYLILLIASVLLGLTAVLGGLIGIIGMALYEGRAWFRSKRPIVN